VLPGGDHPMLRVEPEVEQGAADEDSEDGPPPPVHHAVAPTRAHGRVHGRMQAAAPPSRHGKAAKGKATRTKATKKTSRSSHTAKAKSSEKKSSTKSAHRHHR
jgi:hypothetical protein